MVVCTAVLRRRSAKARNRGRWGSNGCARRYGDSAFSTIAIEVDCVGPSGGVTALAGLLGTTVLMC